MRVWALLLIALKVPPCCDCPLLGDVHPVAAVARDAVGITAAAELDHTQPGNTKSDTCTVREHIQRQQRRGKRKGYALEGAG
jgi:hypothetical protein